MVYQEPIDRMTLKIVKYRDEYRNNVIKVWERSVRASHHFLEATDIDFYKSLVTGIDFNSFKVYCAIDDCDEMLGILGVSENKLEMLFVLPEIFRKGIGTSLLEFATCELKANQVEVNKSNINAVCFYQKFGFRVYEETPLDDYGKSYPILKMSLLPR